jgi:hypothetical protein
MLHGSIRARLQPEDFPRDMSIHFINQPTLTRVAARMSCFMQDSLAPWLKVRVLSGRMTG